MQEKIVITGGPGTGKTSIINELENRDYFCYQEVIRELTLDAKNKGNLENLTTNPIATVDDSLSFNLNLLNGRIKQFKRSIELTNKIVFFDRGVPDVLAYMDYFQQPYDGTFTDPCEENKYTKIFLLPPWEEIYISDNERFETYEEAVEIHYALEKIYTNFGYTVIDVPFGTIKERTDFIIKSI